MKLKIPDELYAISEPEAAAAPAEPPASPPEPETMASGKNSWRDLMGRMQHKQPQ